MKKFLLIPMFSFLFVVSACTGLQKNELQENVVTEETVVVDDHTSETALDRVGLYETTINTNKVQIRLHQNGNMEFISTDLSVENSEPKVATGTFVWSDDETSIIGQVNGAPQTFKVGENFIYPVLLGDMTDEDIQKNTLTKVVENN